MKSVMNLRGMIFTKDCVFEPGELVIEDGIIKEVQICDYEALTQKEQEQYLIPGLVDVHFHGAAGYDFCDGTKEALQAIAAYENEHGITTICPATMSLPVVELEHILTVAAEWKKGSDSLCGIHLEGPFIAKEKKGAQKEENIIPADVATLRKLQEKVNGLIKLVTIAPETEGAMKCIEELKDEFRFSVGHTMADYETACKVFEVGADHVTHLYNAMCPGTHREPSVPEAAADYDKVFVELICDGVHSTPTAVRAAFTLFGAERMVLISDSMEACGKPDGTYSLGGLTVNVSGNRATLSDGTLAGSVTPLYECMKTAVSMGIPLEAAVRAATINPCRTIGADKLYGSITPGKKAHFLILDQKDLSIKAVIKGNFVLSGQV